MERSHQLRSRRELATRVSPMLSFVVEVEALVGQEVSLRSLFRLRQLMDMDDHLLEKPFRGYDNLWEWTLRQEGAEEVVSYLLLTEDSLIPINFRSGRGDSVVTKTEHTTLNPEVLKHLLESGEQLDYINQKTGESFLHAVAKLRCNPNEKKRAMDLLMDLITEMETPKLDIFLNGEVNFPDPDHLNAEGLTALHLAMISGDIPLAIILVQRLGSSWTVTSGGGSSVYELTTDKAALDFIDSCYNTYGLYSNNLEVGKEGDICMVCCEALDVPHQVYSMGCCGALIHVECFKTYMARSPKPHCMFCNMLVAEEVRRRVPDTIYKKMWGPHITREAITAAAAASARTVAMKLEAELAKSREEKEEAAKKIKEESEEKYSPIEVIVLDDDDDDDDFVPETTMFRLPANIRRRRPAATTTTRGRRRGRETRRMNDNNSTGPIRSLAATTRIPTPY
nr:MAG: wsv222-like protein [Hemigrapsus takanoi nimavirus]